MLKELCRIALWSSYEVLGDSYGISMWIMFRSSMVCMGKVLSVVGVSTNSNPKFDRNLRRGVPTTTQGISPIAPQIITSL